MLNKISSNLLSNIIYVGNLEIINISNPNPKRGVVRESFRSEQPMSKPKAKIMTTHNDNLPKNLI